VAYLKLAGVVLGGWQMARAAGVAAKKLAEGGGDASFYKAKIGTARFFAEHVLVQAGAYRTSILEGASGVMALDVEQF
jgi:butyryl-CoA dehydrogenase